MNTPQPLCVECKQPLRIDTREGQYWSDFRRAQHDLVCLDCRPPKQWIKEQIEAFGKNTDPPKSIHVNKDMIPVPKKYDTRKANYNKEYNIYVIEVKNPS
jgi:hypothetical protein